MTLIIVTLSAESSLNHHCFFFLLLNYGLCTGFKGFFFFCEMSGVLDYSTLQRSEKI